MKKSIRVLFSIAALLVVGDWCAVNGQNNAPPDVSIVWPANDDHCQNGYVFGPGTAIKIKANASDPDGSISNVQFFVKYFGDFSLIGVVSNAPFTLVWTGMPGTPATLKAVAVDNQGARTESAPVQLVLLGGFSTSPVFAISSPPNGVMLLDPATFQFSAELLASYLGKTGSVEFFVGSNSVGTVEQTGQFTAATLPYSLTVSNVHEGDYVLGVKRDGYLVNFSPCEAPRIRITKLGMQSPRLTPDGRVELNVVTFFPTNQNVIEASSNLFNWTAISTNVPMTNSFTFTEPSPATNSPRYYRAVVPSK